jgi:hypothetical protein
MLLGAGARYDVTDEAGNIPRHYAQKHRSRNSFDLTAYDAAIDAIEERQSEALCCLKNAHEE